MYYWVQTMDLQMSLFTKVITITPKYVIVNNCKDQLLIRQYKNQDSQNAKVILPGQRFPFCWSDSSLPRYLSISVYGDDGYL